MENAVAHSPCSFVKIEEIKPGDCVKVIFIVPSVDEFPEKYRGFSERLWVRVESVDVEDRSVMGTLDQSPLIKVPGSPKLGTRIRVHVDAIIAKFNPEESL
jgi:hypothetical protein